MGCRHSNAVSEAGAAYLPEKRTESSPTVSRKRRRPNPVRTAARAAYTSAVSAAPDHHALLRGLIDSGRRRRREGSLDMSLETRSLLEGSLKSHPLFINCLLGEEGQELLVDLLSALNVQVLASKKCVVVEGNYGQCLYFVASGSLDVMLGVPFTKRVNVLGPGDSFGEVGFALHAPHSATVKVSSPEAEIWSLSNDCFQKILKDWSSRQLAQRVDFLGRHEPFASLSAPTRASLASALDTRSFSPNETLFRQGDDGDCFFIVASGVVSILQRKLRNVPGSRSKHPSVVVEPVKATALSATPPLLRQGSLQASRSFREAERAEEPRLLRDLVAGAFFGERALLTSERRSASAVVSSVGPARCYTLQKRSFMRLLAECDAIRAPTLSLHSFTEDDNAMSYNLLVLKTLSFLANRPRSFRSRVVERMQPRLYRNGEIILDVGAEVRSFHVIWNGNVKVEGGDGAIEATLGPGDAIGSEEIASAAPSGMRYIALNGEVHTTCLSREAFVELLVTNTDVRDITKGDNSGDNLASLPIKHKVGAADSPVITSFDGKEDEDEDDEVASTFSRVALRMTNTNFRVSFDRIEPDSAGDSVHGAMTPRQGSHRRKRRLEALDARNFEYPGKGALIGEGSYAQVRLVRHIKTHKLFAVKSYDRRKLRDADTGEATVHLSLCVREKQVLLGMLPSPFVASVVGSLSDKHSLHLVLEYCSGGSLSRILKLGRFAREEEPDSPALTPSTPTMHIVKRDLGEGVNGDEFRRRMVDLFTLDEACVKFYTACAIAALHALHVQNIIHRDIKPANFVLDELGFVKLVDFSFAKVLTTPRTFTFCGTPGYYAPEVVSHGGHDVMADWWSLGVMVYELTYNARPFYNDDPYKAFRSILLGAVQYPQQQNSSDKATTSTKEISDPRVAFMRKLLVRDRRARLGYMRGALDLTHHPWFRGFDWERLQERSMEPPLRTCIDGFLRPAQHDFGDDTGVAATNMSVVGGLGTAEDPQEAEAGWESGVNNISGKTDGSDVEEWTNATVSPSAEVTISPFPLRGSSPVLNTICTSRP